MKSIVLFIVASFSFLYTFGQNTIGCTDPNACNFTPDATIDNGFCQFPGRPCDDGNASTRYDRIGSDCECDGFFLQTDCADEIFISEYVEGSNNNKAIELFNPKSVPVVLDGVYSMGRERNGDGAPMLMNITGTIPPLGVRVFALDKRDPNGTGTEMPISPLLEAAADTFLNPVYVQSNSPMYYNGDDSFILVKNGNQIVDIMGKIGEDPGGGWWQIGDPSTRWWTSDHTMIRKPEILNGVTVNPDVFDPSLEWDTLSMDDFSHLGWHQTICNQTVAGCNDPFACNYNPFATTNDGSCVFPGASCNDGNASTLYDQLGENCECSGFVIQTDCADEIFISEYVEGSLNNKAIELFNPTSEPIVLDGVYSMGRERNGNGQPMIMNITGVIQPYGVRVFALDKRDPNGTGTETPISALLEAVADTFLNPIYLESYSPMYFTGNDAFFLVKNGNQIVDLIGKSGEDPGQGWWQPGDPSTRWWTTNHTMIRKPDIFNGVTANPDVFDPSLEWDTLSVDDFSHLGWHEINCNPIIAGCLNSNACNYNSLASISDGSCYFIGDACDDNDSATSDDIIQSDCQCDGILIDPGCSGFNVDYYFNNPACYDSYDGAINLNITGTASPFSIQWSNGSTASNLTSLTQGDYYVIIGDSQGCSETLGFNLTSPSALDALPLTSNVSCPGGNDGYVELLTFGGTAPFYYNWNNGITGTPILSNLSAGIYTCLITDGNGCTLSETVTLEDAPGVMPQIIGMNIFEPFSVQTYSVSQLPNVTYTWSVTGGNILQGQGSNFIQVQWANNSFGTIDLTITSASGCQTMLNFLVESALNLNDNGTSTIQWKAYPNPASDMLTISLAGSVQPIDYRMLDVTGRIVTMGQINEGLNNLIISHLSSGIYTIEIQPTVSTFVRQQIIVE